MKPLCLTDALELYGILHNHLPEYNESEEPIEFIGKIVRNIKDSGKHKDYVDAIALMSGLDLDEILQLEPINAVQLFTERLSENKIVSLAEFAKRVGYHG